MCFAWPLKTFDRWVSLSKVQLPELAVLPCARGSCVAVFAGEIWTFVPCACQVAVCHLLFLLAELVWSLPSVDELLFYLALVYLKRWLHS